MTDPTFAQPERRSFLVPALVAVAAIALAIAIAVHYFPATTVNLDHVGAVVIPTHTAYSPINKTITIAPIESEDVLFLVETIRLDNRLRVPIFPDDYTLTLTAADNRQATFRAIKIIDLADLQLTFPQLVAPLQSPLPRDIAIEPGKASQGALLFSIPLSKATWDARKSAVLKVDLYHYPSQSVTIPK